MSARFSSILLPVLLVLGLACAPVPAAPAAAPTVRPTEVTKPPATTAPAAQPAAAPMAKQTAPKPAAQVVAKPAAFDEKAVADFYRGKTVKIVVGQAAGGGFDTFARLLARYLPEHVPGSPTIIVENQGAAGGLVAFNNAYAAAPKDGTELVFSVGALISQQLFGNPAVAFDGSKFNWIGAQHRDDPVCLATKGSGFTSLEEARARELILAGTAPGSVTTNVPSILKDVLGLQVKLVQGYKGAAPIALALEKGEADGTCLTWQGLGNTWEESLSTGDVKVIAFGGRRSIPELEGVPLIRDLARSDRERRLVDVTSGYSELTRVLAFPPGVPADRVAALRRGFMAALTSPEFVAEAKRTGLILDPVSGEAVEQHFEEQLGLPPDVVAQLKAILVP